MTNRGAAWLRLLSGAFWFVAACTCACAQALPPVDGSLRVSLVTYGPGELYWERFGHNVIVVHDGDSGTSTSYNYGMFDFEEDNFFVNFIRGHMTYRIAAFDFEREMPLYVADGRSVREQALDLDPAQARRLAAFLAHNALPENAPYRYDYFTANCSTRLRDAIDEAIDGAVRRQSEGRSRGYTYRMDALRLTAPDRWLMLAIDIGLGPYADQRLDYWRESFVPMTLADVVASTHRDDGRSLAAADTLLSPGVVIEPPLLPPDLRIPLGSTGLTAALLLGALHARRRLPAARWTFGTLATLLSLACGAGGLVLAGLWVFTEHQSAWRNENILLLNPLCLLLVPTWLASFRANWRPSPRAVVIGWTILLCAGIALFTKVLPSFVQANLHWILLFLPIHLALARCLRRGNDAIPSPGVP